MHAREPVTSTVVWIVLLPDAGLLVERDPAVQEHTCGVSARSIASLWPLTHLRLKPVQLKALHHKPSHGETRLRRVCSRRLTSSESATSGRAT